MGGLILFGSVGFYIMLLILFIAFILSDVYENGYAATVCAIIFICINYFGTLFGGSINWLLPLITWFNVGAYIFVGFLFSLLRTYFKGLEFKKHSKDSRGNTKENFELKDNVFRWWLLFPISALNWLFGNLLIDLWNLIYSKVNKLYEWLFNR